MARFLELLCDMIQPFIRAYRILCAVGLADYHITRDTFEYSFGLPQLFKLDMKLFSDGVLVFVRSLFIRIVRRKQFTFINQSERC